MRSNSKACFPMAPTSPGQFFPYPGFNNTSRSLAGTPALLRPQSFGRPPFIDDAKTRFGQSQPISMTALPRRSASTPRLISRRSSARRKNVDPGEARAHLVDRIKAIFGGQFLDLVPFPGGPWDVPDDVSDASRALCSSHMTLWK